MIVTSYLFQRTCPLVHLKPYNWRSHIKKSERWRNWTQSFPTFSCETAQITAYTWIHPLPLYITSTLHHLPDPHLLTLPNEACCTLGISVAPSSSWNSKLANSCHLDIPVISFCNQLPRWCSSYHQQRGTENQPSIVHLNIDTPEVKEKLFFTPIQYLFQIMRDSNLSLVLKSSESWGWERMFIYKYSRV